MSLFTLERPEFLISGERARLIPVVAETSKEGRITSCTLAAFMSVDEFAKSLLSSIGVRLGKTSKVECFTEVVFQNKDKSASKIRPDGLIVVTTNKKRWTALVEAKISKSMLQTDQIESYLDLAKEQKIDAVITLSNQFSSTPLHHPTSVKKNKTRSVNLYHWSWTYLITEAAMWTKYHGVSDPDQAYILEELIRYLKHSSSGVLEFDRMNSSWKDVCASAQNATPIKKTSDEVRDSIGSWHQFIRNLSLNLSLAIGENVTVFLKNSYKLDAEKRLNDDAIQLTNEHILAAEFDIPDTADRIKLVANLKTRTITASMRLKAPEERATSKGRINWFVGQLKKSENSDIAIRAIWPGRATETIAPLGKIREQGAEILFSDNISLKPTAFEAILLHDLGAKFKGARTFIQETEPVLLEFYEHIGQHLKEWVARPPTIKTKNTSELVEDSNQNPADIETPSAA